MAHLPLMKLGGLLVKSLTKPVAKQFKARAAHNPAFRGYPTPAVCCFPTVCRAFADTMVLAAVCLLPTPTNRRVCASIGRGTHYTTTTLQNILVGRFPAVRSKHHATDRLAMRASYDSVYVVFVWLPCSFVQTDTCYARGGCCKHWC